MRILYSCFPDREYERPARLIYSPIHSRCITLTMSSSPTSPLDFFDNTRIQPMEHLISQLGVFPVLDGPYSTDDWTIDDDMDLLVNEVVEEYVRPESPLGVSSIIMDYRMPPNWSMYDSIWFNGEPLACHETLDDMDEQMPSAKRSRKDY